MIMRNIPGTLKRFGGSDIKLKGKLPIPVRIGLIVAASLIIGIYILFLLDTGVTNRLFADWFYRRFVIESYGTVQGASGSYVKTQLNWASLKAFIIVFLIVMVAVAALLGSLIYYLSARHKSRQIIGKVSDAMRTAILSDKEVPDLPEEYKEFVNQLILLKESEQRSRQLAEIEMQRKNDLITYLAHDLKTPLASVIGYLSLLDEAPGMPDIQKAKYIGITLDKAYRLEDLIDEFFDITRFNLQSIVLNKGRINLSFMLRQMADEFYPILAPQGKQAVVHAPDSLNLWGDADKLSRVFNNVLKNAAAYSYDDSVIEITAFEREEDVVITFSDHGDPIPPAKLTTIFEKFFRLDTSRSARTGGAGLGLAIAKEIVAAHEGTIIVQSDMEKTIFTITLPNRELAANLSEASKGA